MTWADIKAFGTELESSAVSLVAKIAPWLAPLPTAWLVYDRTMRHLTWPWWVASVAGATLELLGMAILSTALVLYEYNRTKRKSDPEANLILPLALVGLYFVSAVVLTVALDVAPLWLADYAPAVFPVLSLAGMTILAIRANHSQRLAAIAADKAKRKQSQSEKKEPAAKPEPTKPFSCPLCNESFASQNGLNAHQRKHKPPEAAFSDNGREREKVRV